MLVTSAGFGGARATSSRDHMGLVPEASQRVAIALQAAFSGEGVVVGISTQERRERYFQAISIHSPTPEETTPDKPRAESVENENRASRTEVTRRLCAAAHARPDRVEPIRTGWRHLRTHGFGLNSVRALRNNERPRWQHPEPTCPPLGEPLAKWAIGKVLLSRIRVVPSFGFDLGPVLAHCLAARRQWRVRRAVLTVVLSWIAYQFPLGVGVWALTAGLALVVALPTRRNSWRSVRRRRWAGRAWVAALLLLLLPLLVTVLRPTSRIGSETFWAAEFATLAFVVVRIADRLVAIGYALMCDLDRRNPWTGPRNRSRIAVIERAQEHNALPYELYATRWRFIGAGKSPWGRSTVSIKLQGEKDDEDETVRKEFEAFDTEELLAAVSEDLEDLRLGEPPFHPLRCEVEDVWGVPDRRWARLSKSPGANGPSEEDDWGQAQDVTVSGLEIRRYLCAQVRTWSGQLVVTVLGSAVIEGQELHFVVRPHVLSPLFEEVEEAVDPDLLRRITTFALVPLQALADLLALGLAGWRFLRWWTREHQEVTSDEPLSTVPKRPMPTSLRERYSPVYTRDMHVSEDAVRHVAIVQSSMFATVEEFLENKGVDVTEFQRQVQKIMTVIHAGDNNIIQAVTAGRDVQDVRQGQDESQDRQPSRQDDREQSDKESTKGDVK
ncbi:MULTISPECIES: hypothetical protein [Streptomyces]|uniref:hypothetical protein n=1 Tax=Streptomyces TaxID=1883 RepID=UPI0033D6DB98